MIPEVGDWWINRPRPFSLDALPVNSHILYVGFYPKRADELGDSEQNVSAQEVQSDAHSNSVLPSVDSFQRSVGVVLDSEEVDEVYESRNQRMKKRILHTSVSHTGRALCVCFGARWAGTKKHTHSFYFYPNEAHYFW